MTNARNSKNAREKAAEMQAAAARAESRRRTMLVLTAVLAVLVVAVGATILVRTASHDKAAKTAASTPANLVDGGVQVGGAASGGGKKVVTITAWEDFQCPACKSFEDANADQIAKWVADGTVRVIYRPISILDRASTTQYSTRALTAAAAVINSSPAQFSAFHKLLFANQPAEGSAGLTDGQLVDLAKQAGADTTAVQTALTKRSYDAWIAKVTDEFSKAGYTGTPTILVDGTQLKDWSPTALADAVTKAQG